VPGGPFLVEKMPGHAPWPAKRAGDGDRSVQGSRAYRVPTYPDLPYSVEQSRNRVDKVEKDLSVQPGLNASAS
jgi:hypothetical protein